MTPKPLRTVLIAAVDRSPGADQVLHTASEMARVIPGAELHVVHAVDVGPPPHVLAIPLVDVIRDARAFLENVMDRMGARLPAKSISHLTVGAPAERILQLASDLDADLIVVGTQSKNALERVLLGSVSRAVTAKARCAVLVARAKDYDAVPELEPPCPSCVAVQRASQGDTLWCERHSHRHAQGHVHYEIPESFGVGAMFIRPQN